MTPNPNINTTWQQYLEDANLPANPETRGRIEAWIRTAYLAGAADVVALINHHPPKVASDVLVHLGEQVQLQNSVNGILNQA